MDSIEVLYQKFLDKKCSRAEAEYLLRYFQQYSDSEEITTLIQMELTRKQELPSSIIDDAVVARNRQQLQSRLSVLPVRRINFGLWISIAAAVLMVLSISLYFIHYRRAAENIVLISQYGEDIAPGGNRAYISFSNGMQINLDSTQSALVSTNGRHTYGNGTELPTASDAEFAQVYTPVGGEYQLILPDGTKAWLNAASSLRYPVRFHGEEREIQITGEVYLEVAKDVNKPFIVKSNRQRIKVLGTAFNVRNYDTRIITTLLHGKIALIHENTRQLSVLLPGHQASVVGDNIQISQVNAEDFIAWKDGYIINKDADIRQVCNELERWYDIKFVFPAGFTNKERAVISLDRHAMLSALLFSLEKTFGVNFSIKGKEVRVH